MSSKHKALFLSRIINIYLMPVKTIAQLQSQQSQTFTRIPSIFSLFPFILFVLSNIQLLVLNIFGTLDILARISVIVNTDSVPFKPNVYRNLSHVCDDYIKSYQSFLFILIEFQLGSLLELTLVEVVEDMISTLFLKDLMLLKL